MIFSEGPLSEVPGRPTVPSSGPQERWGGGLPKEMREWNRGGGVVSIERGS